MFLLAGAAVAEPATGEAFPVIQAQDLTGHPRNTARYQGERTLVVVMTDRHSGDAVRAWYARADRKMDPSVQRLSLFSFKLPFFVSDDYARSKARPEVPQQFWGDTLLDTNAGMAGQLGIDLGPKPWVFALDPQGRVLASYHGKVDEPGAEQIWKALRSAPASARSAAQ